MTEAGAPGAAPDAATKEALARLRLQLQEQHRRLLDLESQLHGQEALQASPRTPVRPSRGHRCREIDGPEEVPVPHEVSPMSWADLSCSAKTLRQPCDAEQDPYTRMFAASSLAQERIFDQELLMAIYDKPYQRMRSQAALFAGGIMGLLLMPFGPIGMVGGALLGGLCGTIAGALIDMRTIRAKLEDSELEKKRLKSLLRWASERHTEEDEILCLIEMVTLEFKPISDIAAKSNNARKLLKVLDQWIARKAVTRQIWVYMEQLLQRWRELPREQLLRSMLVLQTLTTMYHFSNRALDDLELQFLRRMERFLALESVQSVMGHAQQTVSQGETRLIESMLYADAMQAEEAPTQGRCLHIDSDASDVYTCKEEGGTLCVQMDAQAASPRTQGPPRKKPFFKDWADFMDFDDTIKHRMPITLSEFELLLQKESEGTAGWDVCVERKDLRVAKIMNGPGSITIRAWASFPGVDLHAAFHLFYDFEERTKWDKTFCKMAVVDPSCQGSDVVYCLMKIPTVTPRDFLQYRRARVLADGSILIMLRSAEHAKMPENSSYIRVENKISGYILRQDFEDNQPVLRIFLMTCSDVKGMIPKWIINYLAPKKPAEWMDALRKAATEYQASRTGIREEVEALLARVSADNAWDFESEPAGGGPRVPRVNL